MKTPGQIAYEAYVGDTEGWELADQKKWERAAEAVLANHTQSTNSIGVKDQPESTIQWIMKNQGFSKCPQ
jgi:hypothetical protein